MKKSEFQALVDRDLSTLEWDERRRRQVLRAVLEEEKPVKKVSASVVLIALVLCISFTALAAGLLFSPRYDVTKLANAAMEEKYGVTADLLSLFHRTVQIHADGSATVTYAAPRADFPWEQMGDYFVEVANGDAQVFWSNDGMDTSGGLNAEAWGKDQLHLLSYDYANTMQHLFNQQGVVSPTPQPSSNEGHIWTSEDEAAALRAIDQAEAANQERLNEIARAEQAGKITMEKASELACQAVCQEYELTGAQRSKLIYRKTAGHIFGSS